MREPVRFTTARLGVGAVWPALVVAVVCAVVVGCGGSEEVAAPAVPFTDVAVGDVAVLGRQRWARPKRPRGPESHACALRADGQVVCWGYNPLLDDNGEPRYQGNVTDARGGEFRAVSVGGRHACGVDADGAITCWGRNVFGESDAPEGKFVAVDAGDGRSCALRTDQMIECWGYEVDGDGEPFQGAFSAIAAGDAAISCGLRDDGMIECWTWSESKQTIPQRGQFTAIDVGVWHSCGLLVDGSARCWGRGGPGSRPGQVDAPTGSFNSVSVGTSHSCGLRADNTVACWGAKPFVPEPDGVRWTSTIQ